MDPDEFLTTEDMIIAARAKRKTYLLAFLISLTIAGSAFVYKFYFLRPPVIPREIPKLGVPGSTHAHASFLIMIEKKALDFCDPKFMLKSKTVHMENGNCYVIHKHATGVTLPTFLHTIGVELSSSCIETPNDGKYCNEGDKRLRAMINGSEVPISDLPYYELQNNDHILINYGVEEGNTLRFKYNQIPVIPLDINEPAL